MARTRAAGPALEPADAHHQGNEPGPRAGQDDLWRPAAELPADQVAHPGRSAVAAEELTSQGHLPDRHRSPCRILRRSGVPLPGPGKLRRRALRPVNDTITTITVPELIHLDDPELPVAGLGDGLMIASPPDEAIDALVQTAGMSAGFRWQAAEKTFALAVEHVIKFADTAADVYARTGDPDALATAVRAAQLIGR
jgi:hypothetical protein